MFIVEFDPTLNKSDLIWSYLVLRLSEIESYLILRLSEIELNWIVKKKSAVHE